MHRLRLLINSTLIIVPLVALAAGGIRLVRGVFQYLNSNQRLAGTMSAEASRALGRTVRIRDVRVTGNLWSLDAANRIDLIDVSVANGPRPEAGAFARARRISIWYNLREALASDRPLSPVLDEVHVDAPELLLQRSGAGHWNYEDLVPRQRPAARSLVDKISFKNGTLLYSDNAFPHPAGVPERPLDTRLSGLRGIVLLRPDKSYAFDISGTAEPAYMRDFHFSGTMTPSPLRLQGRLAAARVALPAVADRLVPPQQLRLTAGLANIDAGFLYIPPVGTSPRNLDTKALIAHGTVQVFDAAATGSMIAAPLERLNGLATFTTDSILGGFTGVYAGMPMRLDGAALGLTFPPLAGGQHAARPATAATLSLRGGIDHADWQRISRLSFVPPLLVRLPYSVRQSLRTATLHGDVEFQVTGPADRPDAALIGRVARVQYAGYRGDNVDIRLAYGGNVLRASVQGQYSGGNAVLRGKVTLDDAGAFEAQAQGRGLDLARTGAHIDARITGTGQLDLSIRGRRGRTPNIIAQAEAENVTVNGQSVKHAYARADTSGPELVVRSLEIEDQKGYAVASGIVGMKSRQLDLTVDADELNFAALARALAPSDVPSKTKSLPANPTARAAVARLADIRGFGYARSRLTGTLDRPSLRGKVFAFGVQLGAVELDRVTLSDVVVSKDEIRLDGIASRYPGQILVNGSILNPFSLNPELQLDTRVDRLDLTTLLELAGVDHKDLVVTGTVSTDRIPIRGALSSPQSPDLFTANLQDATVNGIPIQNAALTMRYQAEGLYIQNASASIADGLVVASGWLPFDGPLNLVIHGGGIALQPLEEAAYISSKPDETPIILRGHVNFDAFVSGTLKQPVITANSITTDTLDYNGFQIGSIRARAGYADRKTRLESFLLQGPGRVGPDLKDYDPADGSVAVDGLTYDLDSKQIHTDPGHPVRIDMFPLERLRNLAAVLLESSSDETRKVLEDLRTVTGPIFATVAVSGTVDEPQADLTWHADKIKAKSYEITSLTGSLYIDKDKLILPSPATPALKLRIESPYVDAQAPSDTRTKSIVVEFDRPAHRGLISTILNPDVTSTEVVPADISINNINLEFLQQFIDKSITRKIEGTGDIAITARGRTSAPDLEFSANMRGVAVYSAINPQAPPLTLDHVDLSEGMAKEGSVEIGSIRAIKIDQTTHIPYEASAVASLTGFTYQAPFLPPEAQLSIRGAVPVAFLAVAVPGVLRNTSRGAITVDAFIRGLRDKPEATGEIGINVPRLEFASAATGLQDIVSTLKLNNDRLVVGGFSAHTYIYGRPKDEEPQLPGAIARVKPSKPQSPRGAQSAASEPDVPAARGVLISESDPKRRGSEIRLTGSLPLGFTDELATGPNDGITIRIFDPNDVLASPAVTAAGQQSGKTGPKQAALTFSEDPLPNSKTGVLKGSIRTDPSRPLQVRGSVREPVLSGRATLYNAIITPPAEQKPGTLVLPILPSFDLALQIGSNVRLRTSQLDARLSTERDILAHARLLQSKDDLSLEGTVQISDGKLKLPTATFTILPGASLHVNYPSPEAGEAVLGMNIDLKARGFVVATSLSGVRKRYEVTVTARGPLTGDNVDPVTGKSLLALSFETNPNDLASSQSLLQERLAGALIGVNSLDQAGRNPGQAFTNLLSGVFTGSVLPGIFDRTAANLGFEELSLGYDPIDRLTLNISRHLFGPLYVSYYRTLTALQERFDLKLSFRVKDRYQISYDLDEQHTQKFLLEGVWKF